MDGLFSRYRNLGALVALLAGQLLLLAWQIKSDGETRLIRIWAVTAVTPIVRGLEFVREGSGGVIQRWFMSGTLESENARLKRQTAELQIRNQLLAEQLQQAGRAQALLAGQLLLLAWQIKSDGETRLIRIWAVTAVTPIVRGLEFVREGGGGLIQRWFMSGTLESENARLKRQAAELQIRNQLLSEQLQQAGRAQALLEFRSQLPSRSLPARIVASAPGVQAGVFFIDRGSPDGVKRGMAVVTGDGIAGQVVSVYPSASLIMLANSQGFAASVVSQQHKTRGLLKGDGNSCHVEGIRNEQLLDQGEWFYTSGDDRIFPRGLKVGTVRAVRNGSEGKEVEVRPAALEVDVSEVLILLDAVHGQIPDLATPPQQDVQVLPQPREEGGEAAAAAAPAPAGSASPNPRTDADRMKERYRRIIEGQGIQVGVTPYRAPDFNRQPAAQQTAPAGPAPASQAQPSEGQAQPAGSPVAGPSGAKVAPPPPKNYPAAPPSPQDKR